MATLKYPIDVSNGGLVLTLSEEDAVAGAIKSAIATQKGERILRPDYGTDAKLFDLIADYGGYINELESDIDYGLNEYTTVVTQVTGTVLDDGSAEILLKYATDNYTSELTLNV